MTTRKARKITKPAFIIEAGLLESTPMTSLGATKKEAKEGDSCLTCA